MLNKEIFKNSIRENWFLWTSITLINVLMVLSMILTSSTGQINMASGIRYGGLSPTEWLITKTAFFPILGIMIPVIYIIITSNKLVVNEIEKGTMVYTLSSKVSKKTVHLSKMYYLIISIILLELVLLVCGILMLSFTDTSAWYILIDSETGMETLINIKGYSIENWSLDILGSTLLMLTSGSIAFIFSSYVNKISLSYAFGGGILVLFFIFSILSNLSDKGSALYYFRYLTMNTFFSAVDNTISNIKNWIWQYIILVGLAIGLYTFSNFIFIKKDLPI